MGAEECAERGGEEENEQAELRRLHCQVELLDQVKSVIAGEARQINELRKDEREQNRDRDGDMFAGQPVAWRNSLRPARHCRHACRIPAADPIEKEDAGERKQSEPGYGTQAMRYDEKGDEQRPDCCAGIAADLEQGLCQPVLAARSHSCDARGLGVEDRGADTDQRGRDQDHEKVIGEGEQEQTAKRHAHAERQRIGLRVLVRIKTNERLQQRSRQLKGERDQADLTETQPEALLQDRIDRWKQ